MLKAAQVAPTARNSSRCHPVCPGGHPGPCTPSNAGQGALCRGGQPHQHLWAVGILHKHTTLRPRARQPGGLPKFSTRVRPRAGPLPPKSCSTEAGAGVPGWSRAGRKGPMRRVSSASGSSGLPVACGSAPHCGVRMRVLGDPRGWAPKQVHILAPPPTSCGMVKSMSS